MPLIPDPTNQPVVMRGVVADATVIDAGDAVVLTGGAILPASSVAWDTNLATTQASMVDIFLGVALASHANGGGDITDFPVDISPFSVYTMACASETHEIGDSFGMDKDAGNAILADTLEKATAASSCFRSAERHADAAETVRVRMQSKFWGHNTAGAQ